LIVSSVFNFNCHFNFNSFLGRMLTGLQGYASLRN